MIVDTFMFFNELDVLEKRLRLLDKHVDLFILSESPVTHNGNPKPLFYQENKDRFSQWAHKIRHVIADDMPEDENPWSREKHQRACILRAMDDIDDSAQVMISDADEIPNMDKIPFDSKVSAISLHMYMFEYSLEYMFTGEPWIGTVVTRGREFKKLGPNFFRDNRWRFPVVAECGWHLSSFGDAKHVWNKIQNYAHAKDAKHKHQSFNDFEEYLKKGLHSDGLTKLIKPPLSAIPPE